MAPFLYQENYPFFLDSLHFQTSHTNTSTISTFFDQEAVNLNINSCDSINRIPFDSSEVYETIAPPLDHEASVVKKQSPDSSMMIERVENGEQMIQKVDLKVRKRKNIGNGTSVNEEEREKNRGKKKRTNEKKDEERQVEEESKTDFVHVRARRGQATDRHSLAERVRREKISEKMKILQRIVPGCDKVSGKALVLEEIINYVQSLQNQVELLSMKLVSLNPIFHVLGMDLDSSIAGLLPMPPCVANNYPFPEGLGPGPGPGPVLNTISLDNFCSFSSDAEDERPMFLTSSGFNSSNNNLCNSYH